MKNYLDCTKDYNKEKLTEASECIREGKLVLFPTETVYGIGANGLNSEAVKNIFIAKGRKQDNPLILHVSNIKMIENICKDITDLEYQIIEKFFPGPLTLILKRKDIVPDVVTANLDTVGIRMPESTIARDLISMSNTPIAAPSANISGKPSGTNVKDIFEELKDKVDYIIDGGETKVGLESTVIRVINDEIHILRPGKVTKKDLEIFNKNVVVDSHVLNTVKENEKVLSPGMKYKHYAPEVKCVLVYSKDVEKLINKMQELENDNTLIVTKNSHLKYFKNAISYGETLEEISHNIFKILRQVDSMNVKLVVIEGVEAEGLGLAIMNRLLRATSYNYVNLD